MGSVNRPHITNVFDIPPDILVEFIGKGFKMNRGQAPIMLEFDCGNGLDFDNAGRVCIDVKIDREKSSDLEVLSNISLGFDGAKFYVIKTFNKYHLCRNGHGLIFDIVHLETREETEYVIGTDYGHVSAMARSERSSEPSAPNFYKK